MQTNTELKAERMMILSTDGSSVVRIIALPAFPTAVDR